MTFRVVLVISCAIIVLIFFKTLFFGKDMLNYFAPETVLKLLQ